MSDAKARSCRLHLPASVWYRTPTLLFRRGVLAVYCVQAATAGLRSELYFHRPRRAGQDTFIHCSSGSSLATLSTSFPSSSISPSLPYCTTIRTRRRALVGSNDADEARFSLWMAWCIFIAGGRGSALLVTAVGKRDRSTPSCPARVPNQRMLAFNRCLRISRLARAVIGKYKRDRPGTHTSRSF